MARRKSSFVTDLAKAQRERERQEQTRRRAEQQAVKELEKRRNEQRKAQEQLMKARDKAKKEEEKERARLYVEAQQADVELRNAEIVDLVEQLQGLLKSTLEVDDYLDLDELKTKPQYPPPTVQPQPLPPKPVLDEYLPSPLTTFQSLIPGAKRRYQEDVEEATALYQAAMKKHDAHRLHREETIQNQNRAHEAKIAAIKQQTEEQHAEIEQFKQDLTAGDPDTIVKYFALVLESSVYPDEFPQTAKIAYVPESKQLVIEYDLPTIEIVPEVNVYKYNKTKDEITSTARPATQRKSLYSSIVSQVTLRTIHEVFEADRLEHIETVVFNGYVDTVDKGTGRDIRTCLVTIRTTREHFLQLDLSRVDPEACLKTLNATVSKNPSELAPVRPVLEFNMVDPRFVEEMDIISTLDQRTNLMDLSPTEFESLITNLFQKMGLETRQTQASRDGGVDCVAFDPRPIFGGKVVIQAKRYKNTVGVSAVRDLYGTLQNEGASKGILVTTSGYGKAAFDFADGKPIELLSGTNLLYLLKEHAGIDAKIQTPETWKDPSPYIEEV